MRENSSIMSMKRLCTSPWQINEEESLTLTYDAVVSALSQPVTNANILCVLFVVEWA